MSEFIPVEPDEKTRYEGLQFTSADDLMTAMPTISHAEAESFLPTFEGRWIIRNLVTGSTTVVEETDFAADWTLVEADPLAALAEEFDAPALSEDMKTRGEFQTEEVWQCYEEFPMSTGDKGWWDATDEANARERSARSGFPGKVRVQTITTVVGPWRTA